MSFFDDLANNLTGQIDSKAASAPFAANQAPSTGNVGGQPQQTGKGGVEQFLWKPAGDHTNALVILLPASVNASRVTLVDNQGRVIEEGKGTGRANGNRLHFRFAKYGGAYSGATVLVDGKPVTQIGNGGQRYETTGLKGFGAGTGTGGFQTMTDEFGNTTVIPGDFNPYTSLGFSPLTAPDIPRTMADFVNPLLSASLTAAYNKKQYTDVVNGAIEAAPKIAGSLNQANAEIADQFFDIQTGQIGRANQYNQETLTDKVNEQLPGFIGDTRQDMETARTLASGDLPDFIDEKVIAASSRNSAADASTFQGFGASSVFGRNTADRMDARSRMGLVEQGINLTDRIANRAFGTFIDAPIKAKPIIPNPITADSVFSNITNTLVPLTTMNPSNVLQSETQQNQYQAGLDQQTSLQSAQNTLAADQFNIQQQLSIDNAIANQAVINQAQRFNAFQNGFNSTTASRMQNEQLQALIRQQNSVNRNNTMNSALALGMRYLGNNLLGGGGAGAEGAAGGQGSGFFGFGNGVVDNGIERLIFGSDAIQGPALENGAFTSTGDMGFFSGFGNGVTDNYFEWAWDGVADFFTGWF